MNTEWSSIVKTAEEIQSVVGGPSAAQLDVTQLQDAAERLWSKTNSGPVAPGNVSLGRLSGALPYTDVGGFVRNEMQDAVLGLVRLVVDSGERYMARRQTDAVAQAWRNKKFNVINHKFLPDNHRTVSGGGFKESDICTACGMYHNARTSLNLPETLAEILHNHPQSIANTIQFITPPIYKPKFKTINLE